MYTKILVAVENSPADQAVLQHIEQLARLTGAGLLLVHVADGFVARHFDDLKLRESEEMRDDRAYLERLCADMSAKGIDLIKAEEAAEKAMAEDLLSKYEVQLGLKSPETTPIADTAKSLGPAVQKTE